jgi:catechol 2,3-dioxygenase-like lactoylglutathione lyase family enzyme
MAAPPIQGIALSCVYVDDLAAARSFYEDVLGLRLLAADGATCLFAAGSCQNLQVCRRGWCEDDVAAPGGVVPGHTGDGPAHLAFHIAIADYDAWRAYLQDRGVPIVSEVAFEHGGRGLYLDDPGGNVLEFATPGHWPNF